VRIGGCQLLWAVLLALLAAAPSNLAAHEVRPAYLELRPAGPATWNVVWKVPAFGQSHRLRVDAELPEGCAALAPRRSEFVADAYVERWSVGCPAGLAGGVIRFDGLPALRAEVLLRIELPDGRDGITARVTPAEPTFAVPAEHPAREVLGTYLSLGVHHILLGADHLLFVLSLLLIVRGWRRLALTVTAFTVGHTLTLAAATLGALSLPGPPVEAAIALSIAFAAAEALRARRGEPSLTAQLPWAVALFFGLLHGLGFAGALREIGLPQGAVLPALLFFNLGVELGQLLFVALVVGLGWGLRRMATRGRMAAALPRMATRGRMAAALPPRAHAAACYAIGVTAGFWLIERVQGFWP
jgi:hydrogenase/urease accessory protein HupE